jgi:hypothetical protein
MRRSRGKRSVPTQESAAGIWSINEAYEARLDDIWPKRYVSDGLVLLLDPSNPASYSGSGSTWTDLSGSGYNGTLSGVEIANGYANFNAQADSISFSTNFKIARDKTLQFWLKTDRPLSQTDNWEIGFLNQGSTVGSMFGMMFGVGPTQDLGYWGYGSAYDIAIGSTSNRWIDLNTWVNVTCTMDSSRNVRVYKNAVQQTLSRNSDNTTALTFPMAVDSTNYFLVNSRGTWNSGMTYVRLGVVMVYNRTLSQQEIATNYNAFLSQHGS